MASTMVTIRGVRYRVEDAVARGLVKPEEPGNVEEPKKAPPRANKAVKPANKASK